MTREWNTRRITVIISTTNGKKDKIAFAATENAKVCTSVRLKYLTVESTSPGDRRRTRERGGGVVSDGGGEVEVGGLATRKANRSRGNCDSRRGGENESARPSYYLFLYLC